MTKLMLCLIAMLAAATASAADLKVYPGFTVSWQGNALGEMYRLQWGPTSGVYPNSQLTGTDTFYKLPTQLVGKHWCFVVVALATAAGDPNSDWSPELCVLVVARPKAKPAAPTGLAISEGAAPP